MFETDDDFEGMRKNIFFKIREFRRRVGEFHGRTREFHAFSELISVWELLGWRKGFWMSGVGMVAVLSELAVFLMVEERNSSNMSFDHEAQGHRYVCTLNAGLLKLL